MFDLLKKKLSSFLGIGKKSKPKKEKKVKKAKAKKEKKAKPAKASKEKKGKKARVSKEIEVPLKFETGELKYEPDLEKLKAKAEDLNIPQGGASQPSTSTKVNEDSMMSGSASKKRESPQQEKIERTKPEKVIIKESEVPEAEIEEKIEEAPKKEGFFSKLFKKFTSAKITEEQFNEAFSELEIILLENNVAVEVVEKIKADLSKDLIGIDLKKADIDKKVIDSLKSSVLNVLIEPPSLIKQIQDKKGPFTILFFGINGSGKTTSIAKLASKLKKEGISCVMAAADTFRAASIEQLNTHGERLGIKVIAHQYGSDPSAVAFDAKKYAEQNNIKVVLIDTAGRMYTKTNLMKEMEKIVRVSQPDLKIFVGESITGNDVVTQSQTFNESVGIDGIILSKADVDEKAGTILSVSYVTKKPIYFLGTGQSYNDLTDFKKSLVLNNLGLE